MGFRLKNGFRLGLKIPPLAKMFNRILFYKNGLKEFASTQTEKINTEDQVKTARSRPNLLVQIYSYYQDTVGGVTFDTRIQENRRPQDGGHRTGGRMLWIRIPRSRKGQPDYL